MYCFGCFFTIFLSILKESSIIFFKFTFFSKSFKFSNIIAISFKGSLKLFFSINVVSKIIFFNSWVKSKEKLDKSFLYFCDMLLNDFSTSIIESKLDKYWVSTFFIWLIYCSSCSFVVILSNLSLSFLPFSFGKFFVSSAELILFIKLNLFLSIVL